MLFFIQMPHALLSSLLALSEQLLKLAVVYIGACCLKAGISEAEQTSIASQRFDNTQIRGNE
jgi:hypothetical protein